MANHALVFTIGQRLGRLTVLRRMPNKHCGLWECRCDCGVVKPYTASALKRGSTRSCGCLQREWARSNQTPVTHGHGARTSRSRNGRRKASRTYISYHAAKSRCSNPNDPSFADYGGRAISMCKAWRDDFLAFLNDMGERPPDTSLDRIDGRFGYVPSNCRWATMQQQIDNRVDLKDRPAFMNPLLVDLADPVRVAAYRIWR